jgi:hypothetical protein
MRNTARRILRFRIACLLAIYLVMNCWHLPAQVCCVAGPTSQSSTPVGPDLRGVSSTDFTVTLSGGNDTFTSWTVTEFSPQHGSNSCFFINANDALDPEFPTINPVSIVLDLPPGTTFTDEVGWRFESVDYIRDNEVLIDIFPCGSVIYQQLQIACPGGNTQMIPPASVTLTSVVSAKEVLNCRQIPCGTTGG